MAYSKIEKEKILEKLKDDKHYYGEFGQKFLSNSNISTLLKDPLSLRQPIEKTTPMLLGGYFHHLVLEPPKAALYNIIDANTRSTKLYKEQSQGELLLLKKEAELVQELSNVLLSNDSLYDLIYCEDVEHEVPNICDIDGVTWKCKADILNHSEKLIIDLKTTNDISSFEYSCRKYNYDSQAFIYEQQFPNYNFIFIVIDKNTKRLGIFDCSTEFLNAGKNKVTKANEAYKLFYKTENFNKEQYLLTKTL